ncbi:MAG: hypothetical protein LBL74_01445 [Bacteroidales bacterium]|jgi:DNA-directed RNA polymerase subunit RPC12/RpoP|nr:hypothetical protein [Bacteroidales bacterium]
MEEDVIRCPRCDSTQLIANPRGFRWGYAILGFLLLKGIGLLFGFSGNKRVRITCMKCGHQWIAGK